MAMHGFKPTEKAKEKSRLDASLRTIGRFSRQTGRWIRRHFYSSSPEGPSFSPLWTFLCRRRLETTEKCRPQPSTSHANARKEKNQYNTLGTREKEGRTLLASVTVHVGLQRRRTREPLVADLALVLLLGVGGHLGAKLAHHGLGARRRATRQERGRTREGTRWKAIVVGFRGGRAVIGHGRVHRRNGSAVIGVIPAGGDGRPGGMGGREAIRVSRTPGIPRAIDIAWGEILAESHHSATGIQCIAKGWTGSRRLRLTNTRVPNSVSIFPSSNSDNHLEPYAWDIRRSGCGLCSDGA